MARALRLLVVEDDAALVAVIARLAGRRGHELFTAGTVAGALEMARKEAPDAILLDISLGDRGDGRDVLAGLGTPPPPIHVWTARATDEFLIEVCRAYGTERVWDKRTADPNAILDAIEASVAARRAPPPPSVLVVDDNPTNTKLISVLLGAKGYEVRVAERGEQALQILADWLPDLVLADVQMPGMDGLELTRRIKSDPRMQDVTVVAVTAYAMKGDEERARSAGCDGYITKPIDTRGLPGALAALLARRKADRR